MSLSSLGVFFKYIYLGKIVLKCCVTCTPVMFANHQIRCQATSKMGHQFGHSTRPLWRPVLQNSTDLKEKLKLSTHYLEAKGSRSNLYTWITNERFAGILQMVECSTKWDLSRTTGFQSWFISIHLQNCSIGISLHSLEYIAVVAHCFHAHDLNVIVDGSSEPPTVQLHTHWQGFFFWMCTLTQRDSVWDSRNFPQGLDGNRTKDLLIYGSHIWRVPIV